ncbi:HAD family hydrolase [Parafilimonas sp.]|uniref:HAD family hydrolase n=1 Tax=Parafilimonas sp. TaxID=1969739 RepID=UPI0039E44B5A
MQKPKNIIFDLGGVILNIDFRQTALAFAELGIGNFNEYYTLQSVTPLFEKLETGAISPDDFYDGFRHLAKMPALTNDQIRDAWNALLLDFPPERIAWLKKIKETYNIFLLSNTNQIHYDAFTQIYRRQIEDASFDDLFITAYYSHTLGLRKPAREVFETVLAKEKLPAGETVFIDDSLANVEAAQSVGLQGIHLPSPKTVFDIGL